uniref:Uncharacterized protein n=1 Tax=Coccidioides posadasii RMSCC 3488 TaxID=454284 RepID=A0A0J6FPD9_COCPO|nr:hypothetical protein CPAG_08530 [Coccidioides posadasii RMSCC 3488]
MWPSTTGLLQPAIQWLHNTNPKPKTFAGYCPTTNRIFPLRSFQPNPSASAIDEFARLARHMNWNLRSKVYRTEWARFSALEFAKHYGVETSSLEKWQSLCRELDISKPTESITKCKKALASVHVNIFDLIDSRRTGAPIPKFTNVRALRRYTKQIQRFGIHGTSVGMEIDVCVNTGPGKPNPLREAPRRYLKTKFGNGVQQWRDSLEALSGADNDIDTIAHRDWYAKRQQGLCGSTRIEDRLPLLLLGPFLAPVGLFW